MAGFQQAANAITGAYGTVAGRTGIYNELVGKNQEQREQLAKQNEELEKKNKELTNKNKEILDQYETMISMSRDADELDKIKYKEEEKKFKRQMKKEAKKRYETVLNNRLDTSMTRWYGHDYSAMSKNMMTNMLYGDLSSGSGGGI